MFRIPSVVVRIPFLDYFCEPRDAGHLTVRGVEETELIEFHFLLEILLRFVIPVGYLFVSHCRGSSRKSGCKTHRTPSHDETWVDERGD